MSSRRFIIKEHNVPAQHIRELPDALAVDENTPLHIHVTQCIPRNNSVPKRGDITIIALHANAFTHELYEPIWDDLISMLPSHIRVRGIWVADQAQQGESYLLNEDKLANGVSWEDHPRDLLHVINTFREQMPQPLIGIGHSMGAPQLVSLSKIHPRLFRSVAFLDPWMSANWTKIDPIGNWKRCVRRRDVFENLEQARQSLRKTPMMKRWDQRVFDRYIDSAFRSGPTVLHPNNENQVVLKTPKQMELYSSSRANIEGVNTNPETASRIDRLQFSDVKYDAAQLVPSHLPMPKAAGEYLAQLRPRALFLYGDKGSASREEWIMSNIETTGTGSGGSGGIALGTVEASTIAGSHFFPFENPSGTAERLAFWLESETVVLNEEKRALEERIQSEGKSARERQMFPSEYVDIVKKWDEMVVSKL